MSRFRTVLLFVILIPFVSNADDGLTIAVASNFQATAKEIAKEFSELTGIPVRISAGSTGKLYAQILNGAPFDIFLAADAKRPRLLNDEGLVAPDSFVVYATGVLALWSTDPRFSDGSCRAVFDRGDFSRLAIANPATAPYGAAAKRYLQAVDLWHVMADKMVFGENVSQTFQFVATGNANLGLVAASQVIADSPFETTCFEPLPSELTKQTSIKQAGVILARSRNRSAAEDFMRYLGSPEIISKIERRGYEAPASALAGS